MAMRRATRARPIKKCRSWSSATALLNAQNMKNTETNKARMAISEKKMVDTVFMMGRWRRFDAAGEQRREHSTAGRGRRPLDSSEAEEDVRVWFDEIAEEAEGHVGDREEFEDVARDRAVAVVTSPLRSKSSREI
jgi:hypothetical protein